MIDMLFSFEGRINRRHFWIFILAAIAGSLLAALIDLASTGQDTGLAYIVFLLIVLWPSLAIQVKRWHDRDKSGWWVLINMIPIIGPIWAIMENGFLPGTEGSNRFGDGPLKLSG